LITDYLVKQIVSWWQTISLTSFGKQIAMVPTDFLTSFIKEQEIFAVLQ